MAVRPNTTGYLTRGTNLPADAAGWTFFVRWMVTAAPNDYRALFTLGVVGDGNQNWIAVNFVQNTLTLQVERQAPSVSFAYVTTSILTATANAWYWMALRATGTGANNAELLYGAFGAESVSTTGVFSVPTVSWTRMNILNDPDYAGGLLDVGRVLSAKLWHAALTNNEILAESKSAPPVRTANIDSYLSLIDATDAGDDESGNNRDWTVTGTLATVDYVAVGPIGPAAATAAAPALSVAAAQPSTQGLGSAVATAPALAVQAVQPVAPSRANATAAAPALSAQASQPVSLGVASVQASALPLIVGDQVLLGVATAVANAPALVVADPTRRPRQPQMSRGRGVGRRLGAA